MYRKLSEQEAREKASADQLVNTDVRTKEFEAMVRLYKYEAIYIDWTVVKCQKLSIVSYFVMALIISLYSLIVSRVPENYAQLRDITQWQDMSSEPIFNP